MGFLKRMLATDQDRPTTTAPAAWAPPQQPLPGALPARPATQWRPRDGAQRCINHAGVRPDWMVDGMPVTVYEGRDRLSVVGESHHQDSLWAIVGGPKTSGRVRHQDTAILVPESDNQYDANAIAVWIRGAHVGYLSREDAQTYRPGLDKLAEHGPVGLWATVAGGGYDQQVAILGVFLDHDRTDFGLVAHAHRRDDGEVSTGLSQALQTDRADDSYDLSWFNTLSSDSRKAIATLRSLLASEHDPIDRHLMFSELEWRLYHLRDVERTALTEYDQACTQHDSEMDQIKPALYAKFGTVPQLTTYKQQCVRQQKAKDFQRGLWWAQRGLTLYGSDAHSQDWTDDLRKRAATFQTKLTPTRPKPQTLRTLVPPK